MVLNSDLRNAKMFNDVAGKASVHPYIRTFVHPSIVRRIKLQIDEDTIGDQILQIISATED